MSGRNLVIEQSNFRFTVRNVKQLTTSSQVYVNGLPWQVKIKKNGDDVTIQLCCNNPDNSSDWSCAARAILKLLSFSSRSEIFERRQDVVAAFSSDLKCITRNKELIKWQDLMDSRKQYICNDTMMIDVTIQAEKPRAANQSKLIIVEPICGHATFRFKISNIKGIIAMDSPVFTYRNMECRLTVSKRYPLTNDELMKHKDGYLGIWLVAFNHYIEPLYNIQVVFRLLSHKLDGKNFEKIADNVSSNRFNYVSRLIALRDLYDSLNDYIYNDSIKLEVDIRIEIKNVSSLQESVKKKPSIVMECILCYDNIIDKSISSTPCGHLFCEACIKESLMQRAACPICNKQVIRQQLHDVYLPSIIQSE